MHMHYNFLFAKIYFARFRLLRVNLANNFNLIRDFFYPFFEQVFYSQAFTAFKFFAICSPFRFPFSARFTGTSNVCVHINFILNNNLYYQTTFVYKKILFILYFVKNKLEEKTRAIEHINVSCHFRLDLVFQGTNA